MNLAPEYMSSNAHGVKLICRDAANNLRFLLQDGIRHGTQSTDASRSAKPLGYYHRSRTHLGLEKDCPEPRAIELQEVGPVVSEPVLGGLHHRYFRRAA